MYMYRYVLTIHAKNPNGVFSKVIKAPTVEIAKEKSRIELAKWQAKGYLILHSILDYSPILGN